jgi:hypothetical protein
MNKMGKEIMGVCNITSLKNKGLSTLQAGAGKRDSEQANRAKRTGN